MKKVLGIFIAVFFVMSTLSSSLSPAGELGDLGDRFRAEVPEDDLTVEAMAGTSFFGTFVNSCGETAKSCMAFDRQGNITWDQNFAGNGAELFSGKYMEFRQGPNIFWGAVLNDQSGNQVFVLSGLAGSNSTFVFLANVDVQCETPQAPPVTAISIYQRSDCTPDGVEGVTGGTQ